MTKAGLITAINNQITAVITQAKHRLSMLEIVNELFQTTTTQIINTGVNNFHCNLRYKKIGNIVFLDGFITSKYSQTVDPGYLIEIPNSLFYGTTTGVYLLSGIKQSPTIDFSSYTSVCSLYIQQGGIYLIGSITPEQTIFINGHYQVND